MFLFISIQDEEDTSEYEELDEDESKKRKREDSYEERKKPQMGVSFVSNTIEHFCM